MNTKIFAHFDDRGTILGFYDTDIFPDDIVYGDKPEPTEEDPTPQAPIILRNRNSVIPISAVEVTDDQRRDIIGYPDYWRFNGKTVEPYTPPPPLPIVPNKVSNFQIRAVLINRKIFENVNTRIQNSKDTMLIQSWDYQSDFQKESYFIKWLQSEFGIEASDLDEIFIDAEKIM